MGVAVQSLVFLFPDLICLLNEAAQFPGQILRLLQSKVVDVVVSRDAVDAHEARSFVPLRQNQMANYSGALNPERGKRHTHVERNPGLLRQDGHRSALPCLGDEHFVKLADRRGLPPEV